MSEVAEGDACTEKGPNVVPTAPQKHASAAQTIGGLSGLGARSVDCLWVFKGMWGGRGGSSLKTYKRLKTTRLRFNRKLDEAIEAPQEASVHSHESLGSRV